MADAVAIEVAGVPAWWVRGERELTTMSLIFRGGRADESLATSGWFHLLEHHALHGARPPHLHVNGSVDLLHTQFDFEGAPADVAGEVRTVLERLQGIDGDTLDHELRVLEAEGREREVGPEAESLVWRYGARGPGLVGFPEWGLSRADPARLTTLASQVFNRRNCALAIYGPVPDAIGLEALPEGEPMVGDDLWPLPASGPFSFASSYQTITVTSLLERSEAAATFSDLLHRRVTERFRHTDGIVYAPHPLYRRLNKQAVSGVTVEVAGGAGGAVLEGLPQVIAELAENGPSSKELDGYRIAARQRAGEPPTLLARAWENARAVTLGQRPRTAAQTLFRYVGLTREDIRRQAELSAGSLIYGVPGQTAIKDLPAPLHPGPDEPSIRPRATIYRPRQGVLDDDSQRIRILLADGVLQRESAATRVSYLRDDLAGVLAWPDGARRLIRTDGYSALIEPSQWRAGSRLIAELDSWVPGDVVLPRPERAPADIPSAPGAWRRLRVLWRNWWELLLAVALSLVVWTMLSQQLSDSLVALVAVAPILLFLRAVNRRMNSTE